MNSSGRTIYKYLFKPSFAIIREILILEQK
nr:MAG TPA: hypothetical protein [Caudoviricetes sp.]